MTAYRKQSLATLILLFTVILLSFVYDNTGTAAAQQQCGLPYPHGEQLESLMFATYEALAFERDSWNQTRDWYADNGTHVGQSLDDIMLRLAQLADGLTASEWAAIGVDIRCVDIGDCDD